MITCPCCGGRGEIEERAPADLSPMELRIFDKVRRSGHGIATDDLLSWLYAEHPDGGPDCALKTLHFLVCRANKKLRKSGVRITGRWPGAVGTYRLQRLES